MLREILITFYLIYFKVVFNFFKFWPVKRKITLVLSFEENGSFLVKEITKEISGCEVIILNYSPSLRFEELQKNSERIKIISIGNLNIINNLRGVYHLATSRIIIVDNYFAFLSAIDFKAEVECIQVWHAVGALKSFGLKDKSVSGRSEKAQRRFISVYEKFDKVVVGSKKMAEIFSESFNTPAEKFLKTGIPRTDLFFNDGIQQDIKQRLFEQFPDLKGKKTILYAPTFRYSQLNKFEIKIDLDKLYEVFKNEYVLLIKIHPMVKHHLNYENLYPGFIYDFSSYSKVNDLLLITDILITDYSSIPFEFALLKRPIIFYAYDLKKYKKVRGVLHDFEKVVPGPIAMDTEQIISYIKNDSFDKMLLEEFAFSWNEYSYGESSKSLIKYLICKLQ